MRSPDSGIRPAVDKCLPVLNMDERYELREKIGQGSIGIVYRAYDHKLGREVAIKRILTSEVDPSLKDEATKQLLVEVGALASLQHPNIVIVRDIGSDEEGLYMVTEIISGKTLDEMIETGALPWRDCRQVAMQSLEALIAAEELNMIHSDLKPPNIMLTWVPSGKFQVKILDFGLAVLIHNQSLEEIQRMESIFGSIFFMPPEQFERKVMDARSDLYSLGCCLYQALTGSYPFNGETGEEVMAAHLHHTVRPIGEICEDIPTWACQWIMWLINRDPEHRPHSAREALANFLENDSLAVSAPGQGEAQAAHSAPIMSPPFVGVVPGTSLVRTPSLSAAHASDMASVGMEGSIPPTSPKVRRKYMLPKLSKTLLMIAAAAAVLLLVVFLSMIVKRRNDRIVRENTYHYLVGLAVGDVGEMRISGAHLQILLESIRNSKPNAQLKPAYRALAIAKASDSTDIGAAIADFATAAGLPGTVRRDMFAEVIAKRQDVAVVPAMIRFSASAKDPDEAVAAIKAITHIAGDKDAEGLLDVLASASQPKVRDAAEASLKTIIRNSEIPDDLALLITNKGKQVGNQASGEAMGRLMEFSKPKAVQPPPQTVQASPTPKPTQKPPSGSPEKLKPFIEALVGADDAKKSEAIAALGDSSDVSAHPLLLDFSGKTDNASLKFEALQAVMRLNSNPEILKDGDQARQRWVQISWVAKAPEHEKLLIESIATIKAEWVSDILGRIHIYSKNAGSKALAKQALDNMPKGVSGK